MHPFASLDTPLPEILVVGAGTALMLRGTASLGASQRSRLRVRVGPVTVAVGGCGRIGREPDGGTLWWALIPIPASAAAESAPAPVSLLVELGPGEAARELPLGEIRLERSVSAPQRASTPPPTGPPPLIAICMATYEPDRAWLERQLDSIRAQTHSNWICLISDDASSPVRYAGLKELVAGEPRFVVSRASDRGGFYANFERALAMVPDEAELIALADQDDRWDPDKLEALRDALLAAPAAKLAFSDMRIVSAEGTLISETFWYLSDNAYEDIATVAIINTVTGAASLFRRELLELALPFPPAYSDQHYHDHWLALCALATGELTYLDRPTYDYTRHTDSVTIRASSAWTPPARGPLERARMHLRRVRRRLEIALAPGAWRTVYLDRIGLIRQFALILELRAADRMDPDKRRALRLLADAERSPAGVLRLMRRSLRPLWARNETLGRERVLLGGILWRRLFTTR